MRRKQPGFSLIEAAIVLGIVGLVIGGIWVAAASVSRARKVSEMESGLLQLVQGIEQLYKGQVFPPDGTDLSDVIVKAGLAPSSWVRGGTLYNPWGGALTVSASVLAGGESYYLTLYGVPPPGCIKLITRVSAQHSTNTVGLGWTASPTGVGSSSSSFPVSEGIISSWCASMGSPVSRLEFHYMRRNR